jgi:LuxR family transcriptional regulator, maltose regulon positive regulatory protein
VGRHRHLAHEQEDLAIGMMRWNLFAMHMRRAPLHWRDTQSGPLPDISQAVGDLALALTQAEASRFMRRALKLRWMHAIALALDGQPAAAIDQAIRVLREASTEGAVRTLIDEGRPAAMLLLMVKQARMTSGAQAGDPILDDFVRTLIEAMGAVTFEESLALESSAAAVSKKVAAAPAVEAPTPKELRILALLAEGYSNQALADKLLVSDSTVRTHLRKINGKLGASSRTQAVAIARRMGWIR